jgi:MFS family permease
MSFRPASTDKSPLAFALAGLLALAVAMGIGRFAFTPILPMMLDDAGLSLQQGSWLASANYAGYLVGALSAALLRVQAGDAIRYGLAAIAATTLAMALHLPLEGWIAMRFVAGVASAWVLIAVSAWSLEILARLERPGLSSLVFAGVGTGIAAAGLLSLGLLRVQATSSHAWLLLGLLSGVVTLLIWPTFLTSAPPPGMAPAVRSSICWTPETVKLVICYGVFGFGYIIPATFLPVMAKNALQDAALFGWSWPLFGMAAAVSTLLVVPAKRFFSSRQLLTACYFIMAVGVALPAFYSTITTILLAALCVGGTFMVLTLTAMQEAKRVAGDNPAPLIAAMTSAFASGQILGPLTAVAGVDGSGFTAALLLAATLLLASGIALGVRTARIGNING